AFQTIRRAGLQSGHTVLVHAAAGGVGSFAVQIARSLGARVIGTASEANHDYLRTLGAEPVTYGEGLIDRVRAVEPAGVDVILDYVGGDALDS
ncbi:zinc-binding dehydrogenase, partial [Streptomyces sp. SID10244]|nr:zinc-binding dehydrogenase [Streptomyces sp. SID10244]